MEDKCEMGCLKLAGGEIKHDKDCVFYLESRTKMHDDALLRIKKLKSAINSFIEIEEFDFEDYEYKNLVEKFIKTFKEVLKED